MRKLLTGLSIFVATALAGCGYNELPDAPVLL